MDKDQLYTWKLSLRINFATPSTSVSIRVKNKDREVEMPKTKRAKRAATRSASSRGAVTNDSVSMVITPSTRGMTTRTRKNAHTDDSHGVTTRKKAKKNVKRLVGGKATERKPEVFLNVETAPSCRHPQRNPKPLQDNNVYVIPDSDDEDDAVIIEEVKPDENLTEEKRRWIQNYINSITPNRVDFTNKSPTADIIQIKDDEHVQSPEATEEEILKIMEKHRDSIAVPKNVLERFDYKVCKMEIARSTTNENEGSEPVPSTSWAVTSENNVITPSTSSMTDTNRAIIGTSEGASAAAVMDFVETLVAEQMDEISREVEERHDRIWSLQEEKHKVRMEAERNCIDPDNSVEIIDPPDLILDNSVQVVEVKEEAEEKYADEEGKEAKNFKKDCPICLEPLTEVKEISATVCGHVFCTACIKTAIRTHHRCPNCRTKLSLKKIIPLFL